MFGREPDISKMLKAGDVRGLIKALKHKVPMIRIRAAEALGILRDARVVQPLIEALTDEVDGVRATAAEALGKLADPSAVAPLAALLKSKKQTQSRYGRDAREMAADALGRLGSSAVDVLITAFNYPDSDVRSWALRSLLGINDPRVVDLMVIAVKNPDYSIRGMAAGALGNHPSSQVLMLLINLLGDPQENVRKEAANALDKMSSLWKFEYFLPYIETLDAFRTPFAVKAMLQIKNPEMIKPMLALLKKKPVDYIIDAVGEIGDAQAIEALAPLVKHNHGFIRFHTFNALKRIGGESVVAPLASVLEDSDDTVVRAAVEGLGASGSGQAVLPLINAFRRANKGRTRDAIVAALSVLYQNQKLGETEKIHILQLKEQLDAKHQDQPFSVHDDRFDEYGPSPNDCSHTDVKIHADAGVRLKLNI